MSEKTNKTTPECEPGYRWINPGETLLPDDEYFSVTLNGFGKTKVAGWPACEHQYGYYRRKV